MGASQFGEIKGLLGLAPSDVDVLRALAPHLLTVLPQVLDDFYEHLQAQPWVHQWIGTPTMWRRHRDGIRSIIVTVMTQDDAELEDVAARAGEIHANLGIHSRYIIASAAALFERLHDALKSSPLWSGELLHRLLRRWCYMLNLMVNAYEVSTRQAIERGEAETARAKSLFETIARSSLMGIFVVTDGRLTFANPEFQRWTGYLADELSTTDELFFVAPDDRPSVGEWVKAAQAGERQKFLEFRVVSRQGETRWMIGAFAAISFEGSQRVLVSCADVTERREAADAVRRLALAAASVQDGICVTDPQGTVQFANAALERMLGFDSGELTGQPVSVLHAGGEEDPLLAQIVEGLQGGSWVGEAMLRAKTGEQVITRETATAMRDEHGALVGFVCVNTDIREAKRTQELLAGQNQQIKQRTVELAALNRLVQDQFREIPMTDRDRDQAHELFSRIDSLLTEML